MLGTLFGVLGNSGSLWMTIFICGQRLFCLITRRGLLYLIGHYSSIENSRVIFHRGTYGLRVVIKRGARVTIYRCTCGLTTIIASKGAQGSMAIRGLIHFLCHILQVRRGQVCCGSILASLGLIRLALLDLGKRVLIGCTCTTLAHCNCYRSHFNCNIRNHHWCQHIRHCIL